MADLAEPINVQTKVVRFTIRQGLEAERRIAQTNTSKINNSGSSMNVEKQTDYRYFPAGELIYIRDSARVFIGDNINNTTLPVGYSLTNGGVLVGNKCIGTVSAISPSSSPEASSRESTHIINGIYDGDYFISSNNRAVSFFHKDINFDNATPHSGSKAKEFVENDLKKETCNTIFSVLPDGYSLDFDSDNIAGCKVMKLNNVALDKIKGYFHTDYFTVQNNKIILKLAGSITSIINNDLTSNRVLITNNGSKIAVSGISTTELNQIKGFPQIATEGSIYKLIGQPWFISGNAFKSNVQPQYKTIMGNIGQPEFGISGYRGTLWTNIGTTNYYDSNGIGKYDHKINTSTKKATGNNIDIWYNIGQYKTYAGIWKDGKIGDTKAPWRKRSPYYFFRF